MQIINALATLFLLEQRASTAADTNPYDVSEECMTCVGKKCAALLSGMSELPKNWGSGTEADMASMKKDQALAKLVDCTCQNCGDFDEVKDWLARGDGTGCAVAKAEADGVDPDPATEPSGDKYFKDPTGDNTATDNTAAELDPPMELSGDKNFEDPDSAGLRQGLAAVAPLCAAALAYACL